MRPKHAIVSIGGALAILVGLPLAYYHLILDWHGRPYCHKQIYLSLLTWMDDHKTNAFPNVRGTSTGSLAVIDEEMNSSTWSRNYKYVPGLRQGDPGELVLMYLDGPTRWTWHGPPPTLFKGKAWIVVPVDFAIGGRPQSGPGELSERVSFHEFRSRLKRTLDYVRTNERPNWQTVVAEHTKFLDSIKQVDP